MWARFGYPRTNLIPRISQPRRLLPMFGECARLSEPATHPQDPRTRWKGTMMSTKPV
ncbi:hypothetical protein K491DRAFT_696163 [Lophiostoma macrostomum CBS 122681]|uniref:Uncharacterized protein n=1 Tax=Lophiostoma macrostomum CBS 122681 TaxID=1314788 RepID=A0A6A6SVT1_9PLEO|nr:hypothetical protein K491DRAFT_696163 [Lophiostoma macrostomum CBS 122681]